MKLFVKIPKKEWKEIKRTVCSDTGAENDEEVKKIVEDDVYNWIMEAYRR